MRLALDLNSRRSPRLPVASRRPVVPLLVLGVLIGCAAALLKPWLAALVVLGPVALAVLLVLAWERPAWALGAVAVLMPFQFRLPFSKQWSLASGLALTGLLLVVWLWTRLAAGEPRVVWKFPLGAGLMVLAAEVSLFVAADPIAGVKKLIYLGSFLLLFFLVPNLVRTPRQLQAVMRALVWSGSLAALAGIVQFCAQFYYGPLTMIAIYQSIVAPIMEGQRAAEEYAANMNWMIWVGHIPLMRALGPFMGPPDAAQFMAVCAPLALVGALALGRKAESSSDGATEATGPGTRAAGGGDPTRPSPRPVSPSPRSPRRFRLLARLLPFGLILLFLVLTLARQAWVALLAMCLVLLFVGARYRPFSVRMGWMALVGLILLVGLVVALPEATLTSRIRSIADPSQSSNQERLETWRFGLDAVERYPVLGTGVGNFFSAIGDNRHSGYAHDAYLDVWAETGPAGLIGLLLLLGSAWGIAGRIYQEAREPILRTFGLAALGTLGWLTILFVFDDMLYSARSGPVIWLELGLLVAARRMQQLKR